MFSLVLTVGVMVSSGGLLAERTPAAGLLLGAVDLNAASAAYDNLSIAELTAERLRLSETLPSPGLGIALTAIGGGVLLFGLTLAAIAFEEGLLIVGLLVMAASVPLLIIGPILIAGALRDRRAIQTQLKLIDQHIAAINRENDGGSPTPTAPVNDEVPPPPPVRPPGSEFAPYVAPTLLLASF